MKTANVKKQVLTIISGIHLAQNLPSNPSASSTVDIGSLFGFDVIRSGIGLGGEDPYLIIARLINAALGFLGILTVIMFLWGGLQWMLSGGEEERVAMAKRTLLNAIIGLIIILSANSIALFVIRAIQ